MEHVVDYLAEEEQKAHAKSEHQKRVKARKTGKHERIKTMLSNITETQPAPVIDFLATFGD
jgi:uncharacterized protein YdaU (DUF1376 family)